MDILDASDAANPKKVSTVSAGGDKEINSVAVRRDGLAVAAIQQPDKTKLGEALFFDVTTDKELGRVRVGSLPDNVHITANGSYALLANEGDAREWGVAEDEGGTSVYTDETELKDLIKEGKVCEGALGDVVLDEVANKKVAGNLKVTNASGWNEEKDCFDEVYFYGTRSFSIYDEAGNVVFDSGSQFEEISAKLHAEGVANHNADNESAEFDDRSDNKGPEPEALAIGRVGDKTYAFVGAERLGGIIVYDVTDPANAQFTTYVNNRDFSTDDFAQAGDLGPEGFAFVDKKDSPTSNYMLIVGNEVSGTTTTYDIKISLPEPPADDKDNSDGSFSSGSAQGSSAGTAVGIFALIAAIVGMPFALGVRDLILRVLPENLRSELEKYF